MHLSTSPPMLPVHHRKGPLQFEASAAASTSNRHGSRGGRQREAYDDDDDEAESLGEVWAQSLPLMRPFLRRAFLFNQMDFETALDEMLSLCLGQPGRVFKLAYYRKQTKDRWSRDDPAFAVLQVAFLLAATVATGAALRARLALTYVYLAIAATLVHWLACGLAATTLHAWIANKFLRERGWSHSVDQKVEWLYAFDVHCNAFFVYFVCAYVAHFFLLPVSLGHSFLAMLVANAIHASAFSAYFYITHLGFRALPYLRRTEVFLYPVLFAALLFALSIVLGVLGIKLNAARIAIAAVVAPLTLY
ncbi:hypothetical protein CTAYLR_004206 [Chrysophaeum taylorii]|uniref:Uncharacterized protein n=1 Tax=Chrysophaeum taylorii TaxID=2483200 RepID=A0AAD7UDI6_9STRA|nr:hypothetical protein CTAYLR_004206 [Chrysophaeum taylorii]